MVDRDADQQAFEREIQELSDRNPGRKTDEIFTAWFLRAYATEDFETAFDSLTGASRDKNLDAVYIDDKRRVVLIVQAKARMTLLKTNEKRNDLIAFAHVSEHLFAEDDDEALAAYIANLNPSALSKLQAARQRVEEGFRVQMVYATPGKVSSTVERDAWVAASPHLDSAGLDIVSGTRFIQRLRDYQDGVAPPVPRLELPVQDLGLIEQRDDSRGVATWIMAMNGFDVAQLYEQAGRRLFARNIRGYLADTNINRSMVSTLKADPNAFFYRNNGVTIVCDKVQASGGRTDRRLLLSNPQVINGQQTTRSLHEVKGKSKSCSVLVRVIEIDRSGDAKSQEKYDDLVADIVKATNWQNPITPADLRSNDAIQVQLDRELRKRGYQYQRKKESKAELAGRAGGTLPRERRFSKETLSTAVGNCKFKNFTSRVGIKLRFDEDTGWYEKIFPHKGVDWFLGCYWTMLRVRKVTRGVPIKKDAKWHALYLTWHAMGSTAHRNVFVRALEEGDDRTVRALDSVIEHHLTELVAHYRRNRKIEGEEYEPSQFFKSHLDPDDIVNGRSAAKQKSLDKKFDALQGAIEKFALR